MKWSVAAAVIGLLVALGTVVVSETRTAAERIDSYLTEENASTGQTGVESMPSAKKHRSWQWNAHGPGMSP